MSITKQLAEYVSQTTYDDLPEQVVKMTKFSILDALGVTLAASGLCPPCKPFVDLAVDAGRVAKATILGFQIKTDAEQAAFANGAMAHALDFEDAHDAALVHPNAAGFPAVLAVAEAMGGVAGKDFITAMAVGCDTVCRIGLALNENSTENGWYLPPVLGAFGATASVCKLMGLNPVEIVDAFSLTLCQAVCSAELQYSPLSDIRAVRDAFAARTAVVSARLAQKGVKGFDLPLEGKAGLFNLYVKGNYEPSALTDQLGKRFEGGNISFKPWPSCRGTHAFIEAALAIRADEGISTDDITSVRIIGSTFNRMLCEPIAAKRRPANPINAKFSIPFTVATALVEGEVGLKHFFPEYLNNEQILQTAEKVTCDLDENLPLEEATRGTIEIVLTDGKCYSKRIEYPYGNPKNPISEDAFLVKFSDCAKMAVRKLPEQYLENIADEIMKLENVSDINNVTRWFVAD